MAYNEIRTINNIQLEDIKARQSIQELDNKKANKSDIVSGLNFKGTTTYSALPTSDNSVGDFYYVTDGDGVNGEGNYAWNGTAWYFSGKTTDFGDISTKANAAVNNAAFEEGKLKVTKNDGTSAETEVIDSSLTKSGKAADAKATGDEIGQLKEDLWENPSAYSPFELGSLVNGEITSGQYRIVSTNIIHTNSKLYIAISKNRRVGIHYYDANGKFVFDSGWQTLEYVIPENSYFRIVISAFSSSDGDEYKYKANVNTLLEYAKFNPICNILAKKLP